MQGIRVRPLARQEQGPQAGDVVFLQFLPLRVVALDGAEGGGGGEQGLDLVLGNHPPERARIGGADRLAFINQSGAAMQQRPIDDIGMTDHPPHIGGGPEHFARLDVVDVPHGPIEGDHMATIVTHHALGLAGGAGGIEDIQRIGRRHRHTALWCRRRH